MITQASLSSPSHPCMKKARWIYDVLSFRGEDTRKTIYMLLCIKEALLSLGMT